MRLRVNYIKKDKNQEPYHLEKKEEGFFEPWIWIGKFKTLKEAEEFGKSRAEHIIYEGIYENGNRVGMTGWEEEANEMRTFQIKEEKAEFNWIYQGKAK